MGTRTAADLMAIAEQNGAKLAAGRATTAYNAEQNRARQLDEARALTDQRLYELKQQVDGSLSNADIAELLGIPDRQTVHFRAQRHAKRIGQ